MADVSDVANALAATVAGALYPNGTSQPSVVGAPCKIRRGWPNAAELDQDLIAGKVNVTVFSKPGHSKTDSRWAPVWVPGTVSVPTITATVNAARTQVTLAGSAGVIQNVGIETSTGPYIVQAQATDTPATVAAALALQVPGATAAGSVLTVPYDPKLIARTGGVGTVTEEVRRQRQGFVVTVWAPTQPLRDATGAAVDLAFAAMNFLPLADQGARLLYVSTSEDDVTSKDQLWRRDLHYTVEYGTRVTANAAQMLFGTDNTAASGVTTTAYS